MFLKKIVRADVDSRACSLSQHLSEVQAGAQVRGQILRACTVEVAEVKQKFRISFVIISLDFFSAPNLFTGPTVGHGDAWQP